MMRDDPVKTMRKTSSSARGARPHSDLETLYFAISEEKMMLH
jgi:hypothetical protein